MFVSHHDSSTSRGSIWLSVTNLNRQPIQLLSLFDPTQNLAAINEMCRVFNSVWPSLRCLSSNATRNPNLQISGFDHKKGVDGHRHGRS